MLRQRFEVVLTILCLTAFLAVMFGFKYLKNTADTTFNPPASLAPSPSPNPSAVVLPFVSLTDYSEIPTDWRTHTRVLEVESPSQKRQIKVSFKTPPWKELSFWQPMPSNAYAIQSPNFQSRKNFQAINQGAVLKIVANYIGNSRDEASAESRALKMGDHDAQLLLRTTIDGVEAIKYIHYCCENQNTTEGYVLIKNDIELTFEQYYLYKGENPYPNLLEQVASTFTFE